MQDEITRACAGGLERCTKKRQHQQRQQQHVVQEANQSSPLLRLF